MKHNLNFATSIATLLVGLSITSLTLLGLTACGTQAKPGQKLHQLSGRELDSWKAENEKVLALTRYDAVGKVSFSNGQKGGNAALRWEQHQQKYTIELQPPLSGSIRIVGEPNQVSLLQPNGSLVVNRTPEGLMQQALGINIPISGLIYWLRGTPAPGTPPSQMLFNSSKQLGLLTQHGWTIRYEDYVQVKHLSLPQEISLENGNVKLKFLFKQWNF